MALILAQAFGCALTVGLVAVSGEALPGLAPFLWAAAGGIGGLVGLACLYLALARGTMGLVAPLTALIAAGVPAVVGLVSGDPASPLSLAGMALALIAIIVISLPERELVAPDGVAGGASAATAVTGAIGTEWLLIALSGLGFASFYLGVDRAYAAGGGAWWTLAGVRVAALLTALTVTGVLLGARRAPSLRVSGALLPLTVLSAIGDTCGNLFYILARGATTLSVTVVLVSLYPVSTTILARVLLGEHLSRTRLVGVGLAVAAVAGIGLGAAQGS